MSGQWNPLRLTAERKGSTVAALVVLGIYATLTLWVAVHHEPWRDEADSWLVVRDLPLAALFSWTRNAGTPALWYLALKPLVWLGLPFASQQILHLAFAWAAAAILIFRSPLTWVTRVLILACYYFAYEYAIIARSYVLTVLLLFLLAAWHEGRYARPIRYAIAVALLFNVNVHGAAIAAVLAVLYVLALPPQRLPRISAAIMAAGAAAAFLQLRPAADSAVPGVIRHIRTEVPLMALETAFFPGVWLRTGGVLSVILLLLLALSLRRHRQALLVLLLPLVLLILLYTFIWFGGYRHSGLILVIVVIAVWIARDIRHDVVSATAALLLNLSLLVSAAFTLQMASADVRMAFSGGREMGEFIYSNGLDRYEIAAHNFQPAEAVLPWVPGKQLWYPALDRYGTYMKWNRDEEIGLRMPHAVAAQRAVERFSSHNEPWLLLLNAPLPPTIGGFQLLYSNQRPVFRHRDERFWLYAYRPTK